LRGKSSTREEGSAVDEKAQELNEGDEEYDDKGRDREDDEEDDFEDGDSAGGRKNRVRGATNPFLQTEVDDDAIGKSWHRLY